ncbi:MAG: phosphatase PAP2 family protein [Gemmatimonadaceae bacterium]
MDRSDRHLYALCADQANAKKGWRRFWTLLTHCGGATSTVAAVILPLLLTSAGELHDAARHALLALVFSHIAVQLVKRRVNRRRPSLRETSLPLVAEPDRFSFPSGHACAAMAVCFSYALVFPVLALPLVLIAALVGASRVFLGVHYPGDVVVGQLIAIATAIIVR